MRGSEPSEESNQVCRESPSVGGVRLNLLEFT